MSCCSESALSVHSFSPHVSLESQMRCNHTLWFLVDKLTSAWCSFLIVCFNFIFYLSSTYSLRVEQPEWKRFQSLGQESLLFRFWTIKNITQDSLKSDIHSSLIYGGKALFGQSKFSCTTFEYVIEKYHIMRKNHWQQFWHVSFGFSYCVLTYF